MGRIALSLLTACAVHSLSGCASIREIANLRNVRFGIDALSGLEVAGIDVMGVRTYEDLSAIDVIRIGSAVSQRELPVRFVLDIGAYNPEDNGVQARLVRMDWTLLLEDQETISGVFEEELVIPSGESRHFPISVQLDLIDFFDRNARDLVELALSLAGEGGEAKNIKLRATPVINTVLGPIRYPEPITIVSGTIG